MKLYLVDTDKIFTYDLPNKVNGSFLFNFKDKNDEEHTINIDAVNDKWILSNNGSVNAVLNNNLKTVALIDYAEIPLKISGSDSLRYLYCLPFNDKNIKKYSITNDITTITIGKSPECNIYYNNSFLQNNHLNISKSGNDWYVVPSKDQNAKSYLNNKRIDIVRKIHTGDIIFINGLKIIWMEKFICVNNPNNLVINKGLPDYTVQQSDNTKYDIVPEEEASVSLYTDSDYFSHTPRLKTVIEPKTIRIDPAPGNQEANNDLPAIINMLTKVTMLATSAYMFYNAFVILNKGTDNVRAYFMLTLAIIMLFGSIIVPSIIKKWRTNQRKKREQLRQEKYGKYLNEKEQEIQYELNKQIQIIKENNLALQEVVTLVKKKNIMLWSREIKDDDFLTIRVGIGDTPSFVKIEAPEKHFTLDEDDLQNKVYDTPKKYDTLKNVPITFSFTENPISSFIFECAFKDNFIDGLMLQIFSYHSALDLKLVVFTSESNEYRWHYLKKLQHVWNEDHTIRFFSTNSEESKQILSFLDNEFSTREENFVRDKEQEDIVQEKRTEDKNKPYTKYDTYYLIIVDDYNIIKNSSFMEKIKKEESNLGFSLLFIGDSLKNLPQECDTFVQIYDNDSGIFKKTLETQTLVKFKAEYDPTINMEEMVSRIASIPIQSRELTASLPTTLSFLEMYDVGKIEQLNVLNRWSKNDPTTSLSSPIGVHVNGDLFKLDLHEKADGPHGLIAGSTGSGKSEFIITYILSMAINYHPNDVQFVLIDYKGGGLTGAFENRETGVHLPHLVGTITNLDTAEMNRTLVSIQSELKRRQAEFNRIKDSLGESTMDIYKYQKLYKDGVIKDPIAHLFIISDEFAELKSQQPEFMSELISTSRIGRSLGVHLILATQKPSGVVNDQIWSNSKFKICLRVQSRGDSMEMLKRPEAAFLKEAGRFYLQVGYDEYFDVGQSGWTGAKYVPAERKIKKIDDSINFINNTGNIIKTVNDLVVTKDDSSTDQLTSIVKYLNELATKENIAPKKMWLDSLKEFITVDELIKEYNYKEEPYHIRALIGKYDNPSQQTQGLYTIDFNEDNNVLLYGAGGSGKENLISTLVYSICTNHTAKEINIYIADFGAEILTMFNKMPQVGDVFTGSEPEKLINFIQQLNKELEDRKKEFVDYGGSFSEYNKQNENKKPIILTIINSFEGFAETYPRMADVFNVLFRDGAKYGMVFLVSSSITNSIRLRVASNFETKIVLKLQEGTDYRSIIGAGRNQKPADKFGRGMTRINDMPLEFQTAFICERENISKRVRETSKLLNEKLTDKAPRIKTLPDICYVDDVIKGVDTIKNIPIGIEKKSLKIFRYNFTSNLIKLILANNIESHIYFLYGLIKEFIANKNKIVIVDAMGIYKGSYEGVELINKDFDQNIVRIAQTLNKDKESTDETIYLFIGPSTLKNKLTGKYAEVYNEIFKRTKLFEHSKIFFADDYESINKIRTEDWYRANVDNGSGIWLGDGVGNQLAITIGTLSIEDKKLSFPFMGFAAVKGTHMVVKYIVDGLEEQENGE